MQRAHERIMLNIAWPDRKTAQWIREKTKVRDIMETISKLKWNWAGRVARRTDTRGGGGGGVLLGFFGRGVPSGSPNPDPISDQNIPFSTPVFRPGL